MALTVGVMPMSTRNPYFEDCRRGAQEAADELGFALRWDGPPDVDAGRQAQIVEAWAREGVPAIAVSVESSPRLVAAMKEARAAGTKMLTWDSDGPSDARDFTIVHATPAAVAHALSFEVGRILAGKGDFAAITSTLSAPNQNAWIAELKSRLAQEYPDLRLVDDEIRLGRCHIVTKGNLADFDRLHGVDDEARDRSSRFPRERGRRGSPRSRRPRGDGDAAGEGLPEGLPLGRGDGGASGRREQRQQRQLGAGAREADAVRRTLG